MKSILTICISELKQFFNSPVGYVVLIAFVLIANFWYVQDLFMNDRADLGEYFSILPIALGVLVPAITMRTWAEERKSGTIELLLTSPISYGQLIVGKFFASWILTVLCVYLSFTLPMTIETLGNPDTGLWISGYLAAAVLAAGYVGLGEFISLLSKNQVISFISCLMVFLVLFLVGDPSYWPSWARQYVPYFGTKLHFEGVAKGLIDLRDILYYLTMLVISLICNHVLLRFYRINGL